jgi:prophage regulatory protein
MAELKTLRFSDLQEIIPVSRSTLWRWVRDGSFPSPINLGPNTRAWREEDIRVWLETKTEQRDEEVEKPRQGRVL